MIHRLCNNMNFSQIAAILLCTLYKPQADHHTKAFLKVKRFFMPPNMFRDPFHHVGLLTFLEEGVLSAHIVCAWEGATGGFAWLNTWVIARTAQRSMTGPTLKKCYSYCNTFQWPEVYHQSYLQDTLEKYYTTESQRNAVTLSWDHVMAQVIIIGLT